MYRRAVAIANFSQDLSSFSYHWGGTLFATSTGVTTDADAMGVSVDIAGDVGCLISAAMIVGGRSGTGTPTLTAKMQESTTGTGSWTDVTGGAFAAQTTSNSIQVISYLPTKRYQRSTGTIVGTNPVFPAMITIIGPRRNAPGTATGFDNTAAAQ